MRRVYRESLSDDAMARLCERTFQIGAAGLQHAKPAQRIKARKKRASDLWDAERTVAFNEIDRVLRRMAPGNERCMYCEDSTGGDIEHFWPKEKYPGRAYTWENYLWACALCNSHFKGSKFPRDENGAPLLVNPAEEDPREHLVLTPTTGKYVHRTKKGEATISVLGFDRRPALDRSRHDAWIGVQAYIVSYAKACSRGDAPLALYAQRALCRHPLASVLSTLMDLLDSPRATLLIEQDCIAAIEAHPEIRDWP